MRATGITRPVDQLGRVVLPKELRDKLDLPSGTPMEIYTEGENIILKKYKRGCTFCGDIEKDEMIKFKGCPICEVCFTKLGDR